ncbi:hypothetical protein E2562_005969 [Oryza meyeriana var. granulata]|uniref:Splicing factor YJU2 n=1 Tax=Oryza meyeriana var. granulata TaxID=110450 RepID=A0A6G1DW85_9ORYZ|nr:hypothetical protein E2562_005969 [Oryza meyeriana var. granulata]
MVVRMMLPMTVRCASCGEYIGRGTKFNSRKEDVAGERYLGTIQVFRFYIRCSRCSAEIVFKTDPRNAGYVLESGATRPSYEPREMEVDAALDEMRSLRSRRAGVTPEQLLESLHRRRQADAGDRKEALAELEEEDENLVAEREKRKQDEEEMGDAMKALENRAMDSKQACYFRRDAIHEGSLDMLESVDQMLEILKRSAHDKFSSHPPK